MQLFRLYQHDSKLATAHGKLIATRLSNVQRLLLTKEHSVVRHFVQNRCCCCCALTDNESDSLKMEGHLLNSLIPTLPFRFCK